MEISPIFEVGWSLVYVKPYFKLPAWFFYVYNKYKMLTSQQPSYTLLGRWKAAFLQNALVGN